jgi:hypothetical protein
MASANPTTPSALFIAAASPRRGRMSTPLTAARKQKSCGLCKLHRPARLCAGPTGTKRGCQLGAAQGLHRRRPGERPPAPRSSLARMILGISLCLYAAARHGSPQYSGTGPWRPRRSRGAPHALQRRSGGRSSGSRSTQARVEELVTHYNGQGCDMRLRSFPLVPVPVPSPPIDYARLTPVQTPGRWFREKGAWQ